MSDGSRFRDALPGVLFLTFMVFFSIFPRLLLGPLLLRIADSFDIGYDQASSLFVLASAGFVVGLFASGYVSSRLTHRRTIVLAIASTAAMMIALSLVRNLPAFHAIVVVLGVASGLYPGSGIASVTALTPDLHRGKALAVHESGPNLAFLAAPIFVALLAPTFGWRGVLLVTGSLGLVAAAVFALYGRASPERGQPPRFEYLAQFVGNPTFWVVSTFFVVAAACAMGVFSVLPTYLIVDHALDEQLVNTLIGLSRISGFFAILLAGSLVDRFGFHLVVAIVLSVTGAVTVLIGTAGGPLLLIAVFVQPMIVGAFFPVGLRALTDAVPASARSLAVALAIPMANLVGSGVTPRLLIVAGAAGRFSLGFVVLGAITVASLALLRLVPRSTPAAAA
ncbi:MAG: MFS transporter [Spirochaetaceae bacterium]|nr:MAG: MFS transporter [Spirochaetaceae bacterium]